VINAVVISASENNPNRRIFVFIGYSASQTRFTKQRFSPFSRPKRRRRCAAGRIPELPRCGRRRFAVHAVRRGEGHAEATPTARQAGCEAVQARVNKRAADLAPIIAELRAAGITSFSGIAGALNERGIPTTRGSGRWYHAQVGRMLARMSA
jgi:hypothetical protein